MKNIYSNIYKTTLSNLRKAKKNNENKKINELTKETIK